MNYEKLREMEWFVEFERKFGIAERDEKPMDVIVDNTKVLCIDKVMCNALVSSDINLVENAIEILSAESIEEGLKVFKSLKITDGRLLVFKEHYPAILYSSSEGMGILMAPRIP